MFLQRSPNYLAITSSKELILVNKVHWKTPSEVGNGIFMWYWHILLSPPLGKVGCYMLIVNRNS